MREESWKYLGGKEIGAEGQRGRGNIPYKGPEAEMCWVFEGVMRRLLWLEGESEGERRKSFRQGGDGQIVLAWCALGMTWAFALKWKP